MQDTYDARQNTRPRVHRMMNCVAICVELFRRVGREQAALPPWAHRRSLGALCFY